MVFAAPVKLADAVATLSIMIGRTAVPTIKITTTPMMLATLIGFPFATDTPPV